MARTARLDHPGRRRLRFEEDRPVDAEGPELAGRRRLAVEAQLGRDAPEDRGVLEPVGRAEEDRDARGVGQPVDDEVPVRGQRVEAGLRVDVRPDGGRQVRLQERRVTRA